MRLGYRKAAERAWQSWKKNRAGEWAGAVSDRPDFIALSANDSPACLERAFTQHIAARAEYLHVDLDDIKFGEGNLGIGRFRGRGSFDTIRLGVAYKF